MDKSKISEKQFADICHGISDDRKVVLKHNPIGTEEETLLWMLMSVLISFLSLDGNEIPCFPGKTGAEIYRGAILFILKDRKEEEFDEGKYLDEL